MATTIALIGAPTDLGGLTLGTDQGPTRLREAGLISRLQAAGLEVTDLGDVPVPSRQPRFTGLTKLERVATVARWVGKHTWRSIAEGMTPLIIGGDHSFAMGSISAAAQRVPGLGVIWIDAHPDFNTPETSPTSNIHGMVLAVAAGLGPEPLVRLAGFTPMVHPERIVIIGARAIDAGEAGNIRDAGVHLYDAEYVERHGIQATVAEAMAYLATRDVRAAHLSVDLDVLDPRLYPGVSTPATGGLTGPELVTAVRSVGELARIVSMDIAEYTPSEDVGGATAEIAIQVAESALVASARHHGSRELQTHISAA
ncbi:MAG: arginase [Chloroflexota bacterium]|jgi:arginase|nr:arginase [Chloroflexota bacterium]